MSKASSININVSRKRLPEGSDEDEHEDTEEERPRKRKSVVAEEEDKLRDFFDKFGDAGGKISIYREDERTRAPCLVGKVATRDIPPEDIDEYVATTFGGGNYHLHGWANGKRVGIMRVFVDPKSFPRIDANAGAAKPGNGIPLPGTVPENTRVLIEAERAIASERVASMQMVMQMQMQAQQAMMQQQQQTLAAVVALSAGKGSGGGDPMAIFQQIAGMGQAMQALGWAPPGQGGAASTGLEDMPPWMRMIAMPVQAAMGAVGDKVGGALANVIAPKPAPTPPPAPKALPAPAPSPIAPLANPAPAATVPGIVDERKAEMLVKQDKPKMPPGAKLIPAVPKMAPATQAPVSTAAPLAGPPMAPAAPVAAVARPALVDEQANRGRPPAPKPEGKP